MSDSVLGKRTFPWGESPEMDFTPSKKKKFTLKNFMRQACADIKDDIEIWHSEKMKLFESHISRGEAIRPHFYRLYGELKTVLEFMEMELGDDSSGS